VAEEDDLSKYEICQ